MGSETNVDVPVCVHSNVAREFLIFSFILQNGFRAVGASGYVRAHRRAPFYQRVALEELLTKF